MAERSVRMREKGQAEGWGGLPWPGCRDFFYALFCSFWFYLLRLVWLSLREVRNVVSLWYKNDNQALQPSRPWLGLVGSPAEGGWATRFFELAATADPRPSVALG